MPDFHCRARSYLSFRLGIKICRIVTRLLLQVLFSLLSCTSMSAMPAIHHPCHTPLYSILFHPIPITKFFFLLFSSLPPTGRSSSKLLAKQKPEKPPPNSFILHPHISSSLNLVHSIQFYGITVFTPSLTFSNPSIQLSKFPDFSSSSSLQRDYYFDFFLSPLSHLSHLSSQNS